MKGSRRRSASAFGLLSVAVGLVMTMSPASAATEQCSQTQPVAYNYPWHLLGQGVYNVSNVSIGPECSTGDQRCNDIFSVCSLYARATASAKTGPSGATLVVQQRRYRQLNNMVYPIGNWTTYATRSCTAASDFPKSTCSAAFAEGFPPSTGVSLGSSFFYEYRAVCEWKAKIGQISRTTKMDCILSLDPWFTD